MAVKKVNKNKKQTTAQIQRSKYSIIGSGSAEDITLSVTKERAAMMSIGMYKAAAHDPAAQADVIALFMVNGKGEHYADISQAVERLDALPLFELEPLLKIVFDGVENLSAPK